MSELQFMRAPAAAEYLRSRYGFGAYRSLAKMRTEGGGPLFRKLGRIVVYEPSALDAWALSRLSQPLQSTAEASVASAA
jgi:hypothetical protein